MNVGFGFNGHHYFVQVYTTLRGDIYPRWHTCRLFDNQGDAILFKEYCQEHILDPIKYAASFNSKMVCTNFQFRNGHHKLTMRNVQE